MYQDRRMTNLLRVPFYSTKLGCMLN